VKENEGKKNVMERKRKVKDKSLFFLFFSSFLSQGEEMHRSERGPGLYLGLSVMSCQCASAA
jgi:hypothetical protein